MKFAPGGGESDGNHDCNAYENERDYDKASWADNGQGYAREKSVVRVKSHISKHSKKPDYCRTTLTICESLMRSMRLKLILSGLNISRHWHRDWRLANLLPR